MTHKKAIILVSGGLDSATTLAIAKSEGYDCYALSFDYGQRHRGELSAAQAICTTLRVKQHQIYKLDLNLFGGSALTDPNIAVPEHPSSEIPLTYVPARNTIFLSIALAWAEVIQAFNIFIGVNAVDYSGYPDCRPDFILAFQNLAQIATKVGVENTGKFTIHAPLMAMTKEQIIQKGFELSVPYDLTISCYQPNLQGAACGLCDSCRIRKSGFETAGILDPTPYENPTRNAK